MSSYILGIDPGADQGWAVLRDGGLTACGLGSPDVHGAICIIERPTIYKHGKARPQDIITLAIRAGNAAGRAEDRGCVVYWVEPRTWKGQVPKAAHHRRVIADLTRWERDLLRSCLEGVPGGKRHNVVDAVALAKWAYTHPL